MCDECSDEALRIFGVGSEKIKKGEYWVWYPPVPKCHREEKRARTPPPKRWLKDRLRMEAKIRRPCRHHKFLLWDEDGRLGPETGSGGGRNGLKEYKLAFNR